MSEDTEFQPNILCTTEDAFEQFQANSMVEEEEFITLADIVSPEPEVGQLPSNFGEIPFDNEVVLSNCDDQFYDFGSGPVEIDLNQSNNVTCPDQNDMSEITSSTQQTELRDQSLKRPKRKTKNKSSLNVVEPLQNGNTPKNTFNTENEATILQNKPKRGRKPRQQLLTQSETIAASTPGSENKVNKGGRKRKSDKGAPLENAKPMPKRGRTKRTSNIDTVTEPLNDTVQLSNTVPFQVNPADEISSDILHSDEMYSGTPQPDLTSLDNNGENLDFHSKSTSKRSRPKRVKSEQVENTEKVITSNSGKVNKNRHGTRRGRKNKIKTSQEHFMKLKQEPEASEDDEWDTLPLTTLRNQNYLEECKKEDNGSQNSAVSENEIKEDPSCLNDFDKPEEGPDNETVVNSKKSSNILIIENIVISSTKTSNENQFDDSTNIDGVETGEVQHLLPSDPPVSIDKLEEQHESITCSTAKETGENITLENSLLVEDTSKRPKRSKVKKTFQYENESDEDPFANMGSSDDEPISKRRSRYSDDEYRPDKHIQTQDISSDPSDSDIDDMIEEKAKHKRKKISRKCEILKKSPKKGSNKSPQKNIPTVTTIKPTVIDDDDDIEICLESSVIKSSDMKEPTEFENFIAKKIQGTNIQIKKVSPNASSLSNHLEIPVLNADAKTSYEKSSQTNIQETRNTGVQTSNPYEIKMKDKVDLTPGQSEQACEFLKSIVKTTSELGQLMTQKSEDFISKKINTSNVVDTLKMDYCVNKSFLLLKLAKHNIDQMEKDLSSKYEEFLKSTDLLRFREEPKKILAREKDNDSDCEIVEVPVSKPEKPKFNPKTVFLNKELSIKIAKKPPMASAKQKNKANIKLPNRNEVWISDTVMVKKVKPMQSFLAQDSRNKKPPDCFVTEKMVSDFFKAYNSRRAATLCALYTSREWLTVNKPMECRYFFVKDEKEASASSNTDLYINDITNPTPDISNFNNDLKEETNNIGSSTPATLSALCVQYITKKTRLCEYEVTGKFTSGQIEHSTSLLKPKSLKQLSLKVLSCSPATTSKTNICKRNTTVAVSNGLSKVKSLKKLCHIKIEKIMSNHLLIENCQMMLELNGLRATSNLHISEHKQDEKLYRNKLMVQNEFDISRNMSSLKKLCVNYIRNKFNAQLLENLKIDYTENNNLKLSYHSTTTYDNKGSQNTVESLLSMCVRIINILKKDISHPSICLQDQPCESTEEAKRETYIFNESKNNSIVERHSKKTPLLSKSLKDLQNEQAIYKSEENYEEKTNFSRYSKVNSLFSISLRAVQQIHTIHYDDKVQPLEDFKVPESPTLEYAVKSLTQIPTIHGYNLQSFEGYELPKSPPLECAAQGLTCYYDPSTLQYLTLENLKCLLQMRHKDDLSLKNIAPAVTFKVKRLADICFEIISAVTEKETCENDNETQGATEGLTINSVNTMSEEAFLNIERESVEDDDTDFYESDNLNEDFRENSDTEVHNWATKVQMQELRSCFVPNQANYDQNLTVAQNSCTEQLNNDTEIKVEPTDDQVENLVDSSIVKTEPIQQCDEMTIIPDNVITKLESYETGIDNVHKGFDVETFESFVRRNNMTNFLGDKDDDQAFGLGQKVRRQHQPDYSNEYDPSMSLLIPQAFEPSSVVTAKGSLMENSSSDDETVNKKGKKKPTKRIKNKNTKKAEKEIPATKEKSLPMSALNEVAILTRKMRERIRQEEKKIESSDSDDEVLTKINKDRKETDQLALDSKSVQEETQNNDSILTRKMRERLRQEEKKTDALNSDENIQAKQKRHKEPDESITNIKSLNDEKQCEDAVLTRKMREKLKLEQTKIHLPCSDNEKVQSKISDEHDKPTTHNKSKNEEMKCVNAVITRKMREKMKLEQKNLTPVLDEDHNTSKTSKGRMDPNKSQTNSNSEEEEIQCNDVDSTEQVENDSFEKDSLFTGFSALDQVEISSYHKYVQCIYDKIVQSDDDVSKQASLLEDDARSCSPLINYDDPAEMVECEPSLPMFTNDDDNDFKKVRRRKKKLGEGSKETLKTISHGENHGQTSTTQNQERISNETSTKPVAQLEVLKEVNRKYTERDGWKCYPLDEEETKLFQDVKIVLKKLSDNFVATYNKYQEITDRNEEDADVNRLINLNTLNRTTKSSIKRTRGKVQADGKSRDESKDNNDSCASLTASEDERSNDNEELVPCIPRQTENNLAKNLLMNDSESDGEGTKIKKELNDDGCETSTRSKKKTKAKESNVDPESLMLTADKMMNKELNLLHAPVVLGNEVPENENKGTSTKPKHKPGPKSARERVKNDEDSSSEEEKQWVNTKEKLLKRMGKKLDTSIADDAKRAKLVTEFIERRGDAQINDTRKRRRGSNRRQSIRKRLAREKEMRVLSYELFGQPLDPNVLGGPRHTAAAQSYFKGRRNIRKVIDKKSLARSTVIANMEEFERKRRISQRNAQLKQVLGHDDDLSVIVVNKEVCLEYCFEQNRPIVSVHPFFTNVMKAHQYEGVKFMWDACFESVAQMEAGHPGGGCILAHCMGLGKTLQVLALLHTVLTHPRLGVQRILVCCPLSTVLNWVDEIHKWIGPVTKKIKVFELSKLKKTYERAYQLEDWYNEGGIFIIGYELFRSLTTLDPELDDIRPTIVNKIRSALLDPGPDIVVCDEGHLLKNDSSVLAMAMSRVITKRRIVLTGTPMQNNLREYYCMVNFVKPNLLGTYAEYSNRFENPIMNGQHRDSQEEDIKLMKQRTHILHKVLEGCLQRQEASVLYPYLPKKYEYTLFIPLTEVQWDLYKHYIHHYCNQKTVKQSILKDFHVLQKIWSHPRVLHNFQLKSRDDVDRNLKPEKLEDDLAHEDLISEDIKPPATDTWWLQYLEEGNKLDSVQSSKKFVAVFSLLEECVALGDKVLLFSTSLITLDAMEYFLKKILNWSLGHDYYRLDGSVPAEVRQKWCREFNAEKNVHTKLFLISTRAGCLGLNMVAANRVILFDTSWNPAHDIQSIFRVYRFGQKKDCYIYRLVALGTMEQKIYERSVTKQAVACRVVDEQQIDRHYNMAELTELYRFDESGGGLTLELATCSRDGPLYRAARCGSLRAVREHDSLLRGDSEQPLHEHEMRAAWDQFQLEQTTKQMQNDLISSLSIHAKSEQPEQQPPKPPEVPIKEEDPNKEEPTTNAPKGKRGRPKGKTARRKGLPSNDTTPQPEPEHLLPDNPPLEQMQPIAPELNNEAKENEMLTSKILELLMKNNFDGRPEDLTHVVAHLRSMIQSGQTCQNLASTIATALTANNKSLTAHNNAEPSAENKQPPLKTYKKAGRQPKKVQQVPVEDLPRLDEPSTSADNSQSYFGRRRAALNAEKQIVTMNYDDDWVNDDTYFPEGADHEWNDPTDTRKKQDPNKSKKDSIADADTDPAVTAVDAIEVKKEKQTEPDPSTMQTYSLLSDDEDDEPLSTTKGKNAASSKSKQPLKPSEIKKESDTWPPDPISLHPSLLNNKNFIKIVAHTFLEGNPLLDEDAAFLAAQYTVDKAKKDLEANGRPIISGPIYDIAVKVLGIDILEKLHKTNPVPTAKTQDVVTPEKSVKDTAVTEPAEVPQDSAAPKRRPGPKSATKLSTPPVETKPPPPKKTMLKPKNTIDLMEYPKPKPTLQAKNTIELMDYPMQTSTAPTKNTTDLMDYPIMQRLTAHAKNTIELMDYPMQKQTSLLIPKMGTVGHGSSVVPVTIRFNKDGKMIRSVVPDEGESILPDDNEEEEPSRAAPPSLQPVVLNTMLRGTSKPLILKTVKSGPLPSVQSAPPPIPKLVISAGKLMPQGSPMVKVAPPQPQPPPQPLPQPPPPPQPQLQPMTSHHTICIDSDDEESITPNLELSKPARRVALKSTAKQQQQQQQQRGAPVPVPGSLRAIDPASGAVLTPDAPDKIQLSFPSQFKTINRDGKKYMMVPADHLKFTSPGSVVPFHVAGASAAADSMQQPAAVDAFEPAGPKQTTAPKMSKTVCKPGDIIRLTKTGQVEILNRHNETGAQNAATASGVTPDVTTKPTATGSMSITQPIPKPASNPTASTATATATTTTPKYVPILPKPVPAPKLPNPARRVSVVSSSSSDDSRASSPDPLSVLKDVVIINAENDGYTVINDGNSRDSFPTPKINKPELTSKINKPELTPKIYKPELTTYKVADTATNRPTRSTRSKEPVRKLTASVASIDVSTASKTRSKQVTPAASQVNKRSTPSKINTPTTLKTTASIASIDLTDLDFDTPSPSSTASKQQTKKPTPSTIKPVKEVKKVTGVSKNILISIAGNTPTVKNIASTSSKAKVSATPAPKLQPDVKKRPAPQVDNNVKRKKTEPMTLQDFNIDDIDDIIELD